jgi:CRP/FNR family cyclic AMP-dependent transcriptional regulator
MMPVRRLSVEESVQAGSPEARLPLSCTAVRNIDLLARVPLLAHNGPEGLGALEARLRTRELEAGELVFSRGDPGDVLYVVAEGEVEIYLPEGPGVPRVNLRRLGPGSHFGELALLDGAPRTASAVALLPSRLLVLSRDAFLDAVLGSSAGARAVVAELAERLRTTNTLVSERASRDVMRELDSARTPADVLAERVAAWNGSWWFLVALLALCAGWWVVNVFTSAPFDPYPFAFFNLVLAVLVVLQGPLLMMAQNREAHAERAAAEADYRVNLKNELTLERLERQVAALRSELLARRPPG